MPRPIRAALRTAAVLVVVLPAFAYAGEAPLTAPGALPHLEARDGGELLLLPLEHTDVDAKVSGFVARVKVTQRYRNPLDRPIEATYVFPLPQNAAVDDFRLVVGAHVVEGEIRRRADARRTYEAARRAGHTAALLEQERANVFTQSVANLPPGEAIEVVVRYVQPLVFDDGAYEYVFPMVVGPRFFPGGPSGAPPTGDGTHADTDRVPDASRISPPAVPEGMRSGHDLSLKVSVDAGLPLRDLDIPTHEVLARMTGETTFEVALAPGDRIPNRDFVLRWWVDGPSPAGTVLAHRDDRGGFFAFVVQPPDLDVEALVGRRELIFVVDVSGSMYGLPLTLCKEAMRLALSRLRPVDTFDLVTFAGGSRRAFGTPRPATPENVAEALRVVDGLKAGGGTMMADAVDAALAAPAAEGRHRYVFFLTDGYVGNEEEIVARARRYVARYDGEARRARVFSFGVGSSPNRLLIEGLAEAGRGLSTYATLREDPALAVDAFFRRIDHPILEDVTVDLGGLPVDADSVRPRHVPDLVVSRPLVLLGRYDGEGEATVVVRGRAPDGRLVELPVPVRLPAHAPDHEALASLWARASVHDLQTSLWEPGALGDRFRRDAVRDAVTELGLRYRLMTAYTSFVAVDRSRVVGDGAPVRIVQPVEVPEGVDPWRAGAVPARGRIGLSTTSGSVGGYGVMGRPAGQLGTGLGIGGLGAGGGGQSVGGLGARGVFFAAKGGSASGTGYGRGIPGTGTPDGPASATNRRASAPAGRITLARDRLVVAGPLAPEEIVRIARKHLDPLRRCYGGRLASAPRLAGTLTLRWTVDAEGRVTRATIVSSTIHDPALQACVLAHLERWRFPKPPEGREVTVRWPVAFASDRARDKARGPRRGPDR